MGAEKTKQEAGNRYGRLIVLSRAGSSGSKAAWLCRCDCGTELVVTGDSLRSRSRTSCGCWRSKNAKDRFTKHGHSNGGGIKRESKTYRSWQEMWARCTRSNHTSYENYGGRGISVCEEWRDFNRFLVDMGERPDGTSLDRVDGELGYFAKNCRWSDRLTQNRNRRGNILISINGDAKCIAEWAAVYGAKYMTLYNRIARGMSPEEAVTAPVGKRRPSGSKEVM